MSMPEAAGMDEATRHAIEWDCARLIALYVLRNDAGDRDDVTAPCAEDGLTSRPSAPDKPSIGRAAMVAAFRSRPTRASRHVCSNIVVEAERGTRASPFSVTRLFHRQASGDGDPSARDARGPLAGWFRDWFVKTAEGWRFSERRWRLDFAA